MSSSGAIASCAPRRFALVHAHPPFWCRPVLGTSPGFPRLAVPCAHAPADHQLAGRSIASRCGRGGGGGGGGGLALSSYGAFTQLRKQALSYSRRLHKRYTALHRQENGTDSLRRPQQQTRKPPAPVLCPRPRQRPPYQGVQRNDMAAVAPQRRPFRPHFMHLFRLVLTRSRPAESRKANHFLAHLALLAGPEALSRPATAQKSLGRGRPPPLLPPPCAAVQRPGWATPSQPEAKKKSSA
jgi:hypothetical protein